MIWERAAIVSLLFTALVITSVVWMLTEVLIWLKRRRGR